MRPNAFAIFAATVLSSVSLAQLPGQAYIVTINGTLTTIIEPLDAPAATFTGTDSLGVPTTVETTEPVTATTTPVAVSLTQLVGVSSPTSPQSDPGTAPLSTGPSASVTGSSAEHSTASGRSSSAKAGVGLSVSLGVIILSVIGSFT